MIHPFLLFAHPPPIMGIHAHIIFGDGPDGGREATYQGPMDKIPGCEGKDHVYCVIQAKFRQQRSSTKAGQTWALNALKKELEKFADPERDLTKPDIYIFATNVVLTSVNKKGGKDKVLALVKTFHNRVPLRKCLIWYTLLLVIQHQRLTRPPPPPPLENPTDHHTAPCL